MSSLQHRFCLKKYISQRYVPEFEIPRFIKHENKVQVQYCGAYRYLALKKSLLINVESQSQTLQLVN